MSVIPTPKMTRNDNSMNETKTFVREDIRSKQVVRLLKKSEEKCKELEGKVERLEVELAGSREEVAGLSKKLRGVQEGMLGRALQNVEA